MKVLILILMLSVAAVSQTKPTTTAPTLTPVFKAFCNAIVKRDEAALRKVFSQDTIKYFESQMKAGRVTSLLKFLKDDQVSGKLCDVRNEQITGETAVAEIRSDLYPIGLKIIFAKENSEWKMTNRNVYASGLSTEPKPCELSLQQSPEIRGLRLGMNVQGIKSIYPKAEIDEGLSYPGSMFKKAIILNAQDIPRPLGQNLKDIFIELNDKGYITNISVNYDDSIIWTSTTEFTDSVSIGLNLPKSIWRCPPELRCSSPFVQRDARCVGFKMSAGIIGNKPFLSLEYNMPPPVSENEKKKKAFKP